MVNQYCKHTLDDKGNTSYATLFIYFLHDLTCPVTLHEALFLENN